MVAGWQKLLAIGAHADDVELGCGATLSKFGRMEGVHVRILTLTDRNEPDTYQQEFGSAVSCLNCKADAVAHHFTVFTMHHERSAILRHFERDRDDFKPDVVFVPGPGDHHQDHQVVIEEARRCFKGITLLGYEIIRSNFGLRPDVFVRVELDHVDAKAKAVQCYEKQKDKLYCRPETIEGHARFRGAMCGAPFAEAFQSEWIVL